MFAWLSSMLTTLQYLYLLWISMTRPPISRSIESLCTIVHHYLLLMAVSVAKSAIFFLTTPTSVWRLLAYNPIHSVTWMGRRQHRRRQVQFRQLRWNGRSVQCSGSNRQGGGVVETVLGIYRQSCQLPHVSGAGLRSYSVWLLLTERRRLRSMAGEQLLFMEWMRGRARERVSVTKVWLKMVPISGISGGSW